jgi:hypothetical protein
MTDHDPLCSLADIVPRDECKPCDLIARVRADERVKAEVELAAAKERTVQWMDRYNALLAAVDDLAAAASARRFKEVETAAPRPPGVPHREGDQLNG